MDSDPSQIPVLPIPFEHGLTHFEQSVIAGQAKIVAIGSSTTVGEGNITAYPGRLLSLLQKEYPKAKSPWSTKESATRKRRLSFGGSIPTSSPRSPIW